MNKKEAKELTEKITNAQISDMLNKAKAGIKDWTKPCKANKTLSRGVHWNTFAKVFDSKNENNAMLKYRLIQEYGEFLPKELQPIKKKKIEVKTFHQDPIFD